jgi:hypothetical protein
VLPFLNDRLTAGYAKKFDKNPSQKTTSCRYRMGMAIEKPEPLIYLIKEFKRIGMRLLLDA